MKRILTSPGPEDMALDHSTGKTQLIISCSQRRKGEPTYGGIDVYNFTGERAIPMVIDFAGRTIPFSPHGISISTIDNEHFLYAINHFKDSSDESQAKHTVVKFKIREMVLIVDKLYEHELLHSPNDIFVMPDGSFYLTNDNSGISKWEQFHAFALKAKRGSIVYCNGHDKWETVVKDMRIPNGIAVRDSVLFTTLAREDELVQFQITAPGKVDLSSEKTVANVKDGDNITLEKAPYLLTTSHQNGIKFLVHRKKASRKSPTVVYRINTANGDPETNTETLFSSDGSEISAGSTALVHGDKLYISQIFDSFILENNYPASRTIPGVLAAG